MLAGVLEPNPTNRAIKGIITMNQNEKKQISQAASHFGRMGGSALVKKRGKKHMKKIGKSGAAIRWGK